MCVEHGVLVSEESIQGDCCAAQAFSSKKINDFSVAAQFHVLIPAACLPSSPRWCCLQFGELGGFVWRELNAFGWLRQALVHA